MSKTKVRIRLQAYEHKSLDTACAKIVDTVKRSGRTVSGPVPLPTDVEKITIEKVSPFLAYLNYPALKNGESFL